MSTNASTADNRNYYANPQLEPQEFGPSNTLTIPHLIGPILNDKSCAEMSAEYSQSRMTDVDGAYSRDPILGIESVPPPNQQRKRKREPSLRAEATQSHLGFSKFRLTLGNATTRKNTLNRQKVAEVRKAGACIRCRMLKKPVSDYTITFCLVVLVCKHS